jgi:hypothetical protein
MHDNKLGYEISANIVEENNFATIFQASQGPRGLLSWLYVYPCSSCASGAVFFIFWQFLQFLCYSQSGYDPQEDLARFG